MLDTTDFLLLSLAAMAGWFIVLSLKTRELANTIARRYCRDSGAQLLDGSVGFGTLGIVKEHGKWLLQRVYLFDFSDDDQGRRQAAIIFVAGRFKTLLLLDD
jgi:hypothetical protein